MWRGSKIDPNRSRTGYAVMVKGGMGYAIPEEHQGQFGDNFITKAVDQIMIDEIPFLLSKVF